MSNLLLLSLFLSIVVLAVLAGKSAPEQHPPPVQEKTVSVPHIGSIEVLNGCGVEGAANQMADFLRSRQFDVKSIGNSQSWNYPHTLVISRKKDMSIAQKIAAQLGTDKVVLIRTSEELYDVTVVLGPDFREMIH